VTDESQGKSGGWPGPVEERALNGQRLLALVLTAALGLGAIVAFILTPSLITDYKPDVRFYESPAFVPRFALLVVAICAVAHVVRVRRGASLDAGEELDDEDANRHVVLLGIALFAAYVLLVPVIGYAPSTVAFVAAAGALGSVGIRRSLVLAVAFGAAAFALFVLGLKVWFPSPSLLNWLG